MGGVWILFAMQANGTILRGIPLNAPPGAPTATPRPAPSTNTNTAALKLAPRV